MDKYLNLLADQFVDATMVKNKDIKSKAFMNELLHWLKYRRDIAVRYLDFLEDFMGLSQVYDSSTAEVGKGQYDSIVKRSTTKYGEDVNTTIITPYIDGFNDVKQGRIINSDLMVYGGTPLLVDETEIMKPIVSSSRLTFMTQNPYNGYSIKNWEQLHNSGRCDIIVGAFGTIYDYDAHRKIEQLERFKNFLMKPILDEYFVEGNFYYSVVASDKKNRVHSITRMR